jgi:hypothetical protein
LYAATLAPGLTWAHRSSDGGDFLAAALVRGVPHPSGYPLYVLLLRLIAGFSPAGVGPARAANVFSALCAALAVAVFASLVAAMLRGARWAGWVAVSAALCLAASPALWSQAVVTEVHALLFLFSISLMALCWRWRATGGLIAIGLAFGLALGAHLSVLLFAPAMALWFWDNRRCFGAHAVREWAAAGGALLLGLAVYAYLPLAAAADPPVNWGDPDSPGRFWQVVSAQIYRPLVFGVDPRDAPGRLAAWVSEALRQFGGGPWGALIALVGLWQLDRRDHAWWRFTALIALAFSIYAIGYDASDSYLYLIPAWAAAALWLAVGLGWIVDRAAAARSSDLLLPLVACTLAVLPVIAVVRQWEDMDARGDRSAQDFLDAALAQAEPGAVILAGEDAETFALWYGIYGLGRRPDLTPVNVRLYAFPWYRQTLASHHPEIASAVENATDIDALVTELAQRLPIYRAGPVELEVPGLREQPEGALVRMTPR